MSLTGVRLLAKDEIPAVEPNCVGLAAVHCPSTSIVDYSQVTAALADDVASRTGNALLLQHEIAALDVEGAEGGGDPGVHVVCKVRRCCFPWCHFV